MVGWLADRLVDQGTRTVTEHGNGMARRPKQRAKCGRRGFVRRMHAKARLRFSEPGPTCPGSSLPGRQHSPRPNKQAGARGHS